MHQLSYALVPALTTDDALTNARSVFDRLVEITGHDPTGFDEYWLLTDDNRTIELTTRGDDLPTVVRLDSEQGQELLDRGWQATQQTFERNLTKIKESLDTLSEQQIQQNTDLVRLNCLRLGQSTGPGIFLYDRNGNGIRDRAHLERLLATDLPAELAYWVVPADTYF
jgi:hypothetical protein